MNPHLVLDVLLRRLTKNLPRVERSELIKQILLWFEARDKLDTHGVPISEVLSYIEREITNMGSTLRTIRGYLSRLQAQGLIIEGKYGYKLKISSKGKNWLKRKV